jgi:hypothetical protein
MLLEDLTWPLGKPIAGARVRDLRECDHIITYPYSSHVFFRLPQLACHISLTLPEPLAIHGLYYFLLPIIKYKYFAVFTRYKKLSTLTNNIAIIPLARSQISPKVLGLPICQRKPVSIIASKKTKTTGHKLRHKLINQLKLANIYIDILGRGYQPYDQDHEGLLPYKYSMVIENAKEDNYFTEKIVNCLLCRTVPIYWGCSDISEYFDTSNWLIFDTVDEGIDLIKKARFQTPDETLIEKNYRQALDYLDPDSLCANYILNLSNG